jgi:PKD repeat protein
MPTVIYQNPGVYDARLIVGNNIGFDTLLLEDLITVYPDPVSAFIADIDGATVDFLNTSTGATIYNWMIDGHSFGSEDITYTFDEDGDYPVQLIATGPCGSDTSVQIIHIATPPVAGFASNVTDGCQPMQFFNTLSPTIDSCMGV